VRLYVALDMQTFWLARDTEWKDEQGRVVCEHLSADGTWKPHPEGEHCEVLPLDTICVYEGKLDDAA
jgi:hypothetical protein